MIKLELITKSAPMLGQSAYIALTGGSMDEQGNYMVTLAEFSTAALKGQVDGIKERLDALIAAAELRFRSGRRL